MIEKDNGGAAFPTKGGMVFYVPSEYRDEIKSDVEKLQESTGGMTLRDYFAAQALPMANAAVGPNPGGWLGVARAAYSIADAMLEARKK